MSCTEWRSRLAAWLAARWESDDAPAPPELLEHAAGCPECAARLQAAQRLAEGPRARPLPPPGLAGRVSRRVLHQPPVGGTPFPRPGVLRPVVRWALLPLAAALVAAVGTAAFLGAFRAPGRAEAGLAGLAGRSVIVRFVLEAPQASRVSVVGDWNRWDPEAQPMSDADGDGVWEILVPLRRGQEHQYQFLVDGSLWVPDPGAPLSVQDGLGGTNSVLQI